MPTVQQNKYIDFLYDTLTGTSRKNLFSVFTKTGRFSKSFKAFIKSNGGMYDDVDLLQPLNKAFNPITGNSVKRDTVYTKKGKLRKRFKDFKAKNEPRIVEQYVVDSFQSFTATRYITANVTTLEQLYNLFRGVLDDLAQVGFVKLFFRSRISGAFIYRTIREANMFDIETFQEYIESIFQGKNEGSDGVDSEEYELFMDMFDINQTLIGGDGEALLLFECMNFKSGHCYKDVLDNVDGLGCPESEPECTRCKKCDMKCSLCFNHTTHVPFWGCGHCRVSHGFKSYPSYQHALNEDDTKRYRNANPQNRFYNHFEKALNDICHKYHKHVNMYANAFTLDKKVGTKRIRKQKPIVGQLEERAILVNTNYEKICGVKKELFYKLNLQQFKEIRPTCLKSFPIKDKNEQSGIIDEDDIEFIQIVFDPLQQHYDIIKEFRFIDSLYISASNIVCKMKDDDLFCNSFTPIYAAKHLNRLTHTDQIYKRKRLFWDVETVMDRKAKNVMMPYSISFCVMTDTQLDEVEKLDGENTKKSTKELFKIVKSCTTCLIGYDCVVEFVKWIIKNQKDTRFELVSFNGSNFDHFLLLDTLLDSRHTFGEECEVSNIFYNGSSVLSLKLQGRHSIFDIARHVVGSLDSNCKGFKVNCVAKSSFDHNEAQRLHDCGELIQHMTGNKQLIDYNNRDVWSLAVIFRRYCNALSETSVTKKYSEDICKRPTVGGMVWDLMKNHFKNFDTLQTVNDNTKCQRIHFPKLNNEQYNDILKYKTAGRVQLFNGVQRIEEKISSLDIASQYPFIMACADVYFPCGDIIETQTFNEDKIGFYYCDIDQSALKAKNLPNIVARKEYTLKKNGEEGALIGNNWACDEIIKDNLINSVTIQHLIDNGCDVKIKSGFYFTDKARSCDVFRPILELMKIKIEQDLLKRAKDKAYNPSLRETCKLLMNSVSGKVIEGLHLEKVEQMGVDRFAELLAASLDPSSNIESISAINMCGTKLFAEYKIGQDEKQLKKQRPVYLGVLIYAYAQRHIYETGYKVIGLKDLVYTDTDSFKTRASVFERADVKQYYENATVSVWDDVHEYDKTYANYENNKHPIYTEHSKVFGSYEEELPENDFSVFAQKKGYIILNTNWYKDPNHPKHSESLHAGFKGIPMKSILISSLDMPFIGKCVNKHKNGTSTVKYAITDQTKAIEYANNNECKQIKNNALDFANQLYDKREAYILTTSFRKIIKNMKTCDNLNDTEKMNKSIHKIQVVAVLKKITVAQD